ncbi:MAG: omcB [Planctomycetota bacterium]|nr:omcB [Planctomycetota bacterium]
MTRRLLTAMVTALVLYGVVGARLGQAQQPPRRAPVAPADEPPRIPADSEKDKDPPPPGDPPPLLPSGDPPPAPEKGDNTPKNRPVPIPKAEKPTAPAPDPVEPAELGKGQDAPKGDNPFGPETVPPAGDPKTDDVIPAQAPAGDGGPLPPAKVKDGAAPPASGAAPDPKILPPDRLPLGPSTAALTVDVQAPANANLNRPVKFKIFIKNSGTSPAMGVVVNDLLPDGLEFVKSEPPPREVIGGNNLHWQLDTLAAGAEKVITLTLIPKRTGDFDHAPNVSLRTGSKSRTLVKEPRLKVELTHEESGPVLRGRPVNFAVRVTNNGSGPARGVVLHANLTAGLKHEAGQTIEVVFKDYLGRDTLNPGESEAIPLEVDAVSGGEQLCKVFADSPDVEPNTPQSQGEAKVTVVEPKLILELKGSHERHTDTVGTYTMSVANNGTATAKKVVAAAFLPNLGGRLESVPAGTRYDEKTRRIYWPVGDLAPGELKPLTFNVRLGGVGIFTVDAVAEATSCPRETKAATTHVVGMPNIKCVVISQTSVLDLNEQAVYEIQLKNVGTKDAIGVQVKAVLSEHLLVVATDGTKDVAKSSTKIEEAHDSTFPLIDLPTGGSQRLTLVVRAIKAGVAECTVTETHDGRTTKYSEQMKVTDPK